MVLRSWYGMCGTELGYGATQQLFNHVNVATAIHLLANLLCGSLSLPLSLSLSPSLPLFFLSSSFSSFSPSPPPQPPFTPPKSGQRPALSVVKSVETGKANPIPPPPQHGPPPSSTSGQKSKRRALVKRSKAKAKPRLRVVKKRPTPAPRSAAARLSAYGGHTRSPEWSKTGTERGHDLTVDQREWSKTGTCGIERGCSVTFERLVLSEGLTVDQREWSKIAVKQLTGPALRHADRMSEREVLLLLRFSAVLAPVLIAYTTREFTQYRGAAIARLSTPTPLRF
eukprot:3941247-Rhodomonas_salina.1